VIGRPKLFEEIHVLFEPGKPGRELIHIFQEARHQFVVCAIAQSFRLTTKTEGREGRSPSEHKDDEEKPEKLCHR
jgi:hypothetical protein